MIGSSSQTHKCNSVERNDLTRCTGQYARVFWSVYKGRVVSRVHDPLELSSWGSYRTGLTAWGN